MFISSRDLDKGVCSVVQTEIGATTYFLGGQSKGVEDSYEVGGRGSSRAFQNSHIFAEKMDSKRQINQYIYKIIFNMPNMPSFYAFNPNHSALQPITYNTNTS